MKPFFAAAALATAIALPGCVIIDADEDDFTADFERTSSRTVHGALVEENAVSIWVRSNGCTSEADFSFDVDRESDRLYSVEFRRDDADTCRAAPTIEQLSWTFDRLNIPEGSRVIMKHAVRS
ncbi:MAG: hypothetical protein AAFQ22_11945 [Pseudomonadota bacterium]